MRVLSFALGLPLLFLVACATAPASGNDKQSLEIVRATPGAASTGPCGWIYVYNRASGRPNACVTIWPNQTWSFGEQTQPGAFASRLAEGSIDRGIARGFPVEVLRDARVLYTAGGVEARLGGQPIQYHGDARPGV
jgi:hypothetical protein